jgi:hypothetical protein
MTTKLKALRGEGKKTVKWAHGKYPPLKPGGPVRIDAAAPSSPYVLRWDLYETPEPKVKP